MKDDLLNSLLMITINGLAFKTAEYLMEEVTNIYQSKTHWKHPGNFSTTVKVKKVSISTQTITIDDDVDDQVETIDKKLQETIKTLNLGLEMNLKMIVTTTMTKMMTVQVLIVKQMIISERNTYFFNWIFNPTSSLVWIS